MDNKEKEIVEETPGQQSIFTNEEFPTEGYDKRIRHARTAIFVVGGAQLLAGSVIAFSGPEEQRWLTLGIYIFLAVVFIAIGFWSKKQPFAAIVTALSLYAGLIILGAIVDPSSIVDGIILKVIIIVYLASGINNAREAERIKASMES